MVGLDERGAIVLREKVSRLRIAARLVNVQPCLIGITGDRTILGRITKRGNRYLRMLFIQGARAVLLHPASWAKHNFGSWLAAAARRLHCNVLTVALANKLARIALSVLIEGRNYETRVAPTSVPA